MRISLWAIAIPAAMKETELLLCTLTVSQRRKSCRMKLLLNSSVQQMLKLEKLLDGTERKRGKLQNGDIYLKPAEQTGSHKRKVQTETCVDLCSSAMQ